MSDESRIGGRTREEWEAILTNANDQGSGNHLYRGPIGPATADALLDAAFSSTEGDGRLREALTWIIAYAGERAKGWGAGDAQGMLDIRTHAKAALSPAPPQEMNAAKDPPCVCDGYYMLGQWVHDAHHCGRRAAITHAEVLAQGLTDALDRLSSPSPPQALPLIEHEFWACDCYADCAIDGKCHFDIAPRGCFSRDVCGQSASAHSIPKEGNR